MGSMRTARDLENGRRRAGAGRLSRIGAGLLLATALLSAAPSGRAEPSPDRESASPKPDTTPPDSTQRDRLAPGDRLTITILDQPELSGVFQVEPSGEVVIPLLGRIAAAGSTVETLRAALVARFADGYIQNPNIVVRLAELRPVTVVGAVRTPGRYAFLEGMTVATALALSGGLSALTSEEALARADFLASQQQLGAQEINYVGQLARRARIEASLAGTAITPPAVAPSEKETLARFLATEERVLAANRDSLARQRALLAEQSKQITSDIDVFSQQLALEKEQASLLDKQVDSVRQLLTNGLTRQASLLDIERERSRSRSNLAQLAGSVARTRSLQVEAQFRLDQLETAAREADVAALQTVNQQIAESEATLPLARELRDVRRGRLAHLPAPVATPPLISLTRFSDGAFVHSPALLDAPVWPGDVIQVGSDEDLLQPGGLPPGTASPVAALGGAAAPRGADTVPPDATAEAR